MNTRAIEVVGTFQGFWTQWVRQVLVGVGHADVHSDPSSWQSFDALLRMRPDSNVLVFVEHPATGLAHSLDRGEDIDPEAWLDDWLTSARTLLGYAHRNPDTTILVQSDEVQRWPQRLAQLLRLRWGDLFAAPSRIVQDYRPDALSRALAWSFVERDLDLQDLVSELTASCVILRGSRSASAPLVPDGIVDGAVAACRLAELMQTERHLAQVKSDREAERDALCCELQAAADECAQLATTVQALEAERNGMMARADAADRALIDARSRLEAEVLERNALASRLDEAASRQESNARELTAARQNAAALNRQLDEGRAAREQAEKQRSKIEQELAQDMKQRSALEQELAQATKHRSTLAQELAQATKQRGTLEQELTQATKQLSTLAQELAQATKQRSTLEQELAQATKRRGTLEQDLAQAARQRSTLEQDLAQAARHRSTLEQDLTQVKKHRSTLEQELVQATNQRSTVEQELAQAKKQRSTLEQELVSAKEAARAAGQEGDVLLQQLHQVQEELERTFLAKHDADNALLAAKVPDPRRLEQDLRSAREECELLTLQTHQVQQELERVHAERVRLAHEARSRVALPGLDDIAIGEVAVVGERDTPPHREVSFVVRQVQAGERRVAEASLRLAEHWGRPGLVIFADEGGASLFETWRESGREDGRPYMLLVHGEESAQAVYDAMGTLDWQLAQALAVRLGQALQDHAGDLSRAWRAIAQRLLTSLHEHPARLRYDNVVVTPIEEEPPENARFKLVLERVSYKGRTWQRLPIQWQPNGPTPSLDLVSDEESGPPLLAWPTDAAGAPVRTLRLPLGDDPGAVEIRAVWDTLSGSDRAFVAELLNLMPILAVHLQAAAASAGDSARQLDLQAAATETMLLGRAALQAPGGARPQAQPRRPLLQRMASRMGVTARSPSATAPAIEPALDR
jgi:predicted  nucleic acid-binding Zn-ribbon protein